MNLRQNLLGAWFAAAALICPPADAGDVQRAASLGDAADRIIVKFRDSGAMRAQGAASEVVIRDSISALGARTGMRLQVARSVSSRTHAVSLERQLRGAELQDAIARISRDAAVEYAVADRRKYRSLVPSDPLYGTAQTSQQWWLTPPGGAIVSSINAPAAWDVTVGSADIVVAVIDSGALFDHPDLGRAAQGGKLLPGYDMVSEADVANDGDGRDADPSDPGDWITHADLGNSVFADCSVADSSWHGAHIAGIIGARSNNGIGVAGIGWNTPVLPVRVLGKCFGYDSDIIAGMRWAAGLSVPGVPSNPTPARVLNLSLGAQGACTKPYSDAANELKAINVLVVAAAGNDSNGGSDEPANCPGVVSVTALRHVGTKVGFANWGSDVTLAAPGGNCVNVAPGSACLYPIVSTSNDGTQQPGKMTYDGQVGTSFSTPMVAGVAALMLSVNGNLTPAQIAQRLRLTARAFPPPDLALLSCDDPLFKADAQGNLPNDGQCNCTANSCGAGMMDAGAAVRSANNPVAVVAGLSTLAGGQTANYDGSASIGSPGTSITAYRWQVTGTGTATLGSPTAAQTSLCAAQGAYTLSLTVTDSSGRSDVRSIALTAVGGSGCGSGSGGGSGSSGGGGALSALQLLLLLGFALVARLRPQRGDSADFAAPRRL